MTTQISDINEVGDDWLKAANKIYKNERDLRKNYRGRSL